MFEVIGDKTCAAENHHDDHHKKKAIVGKIIIEIAGIDLKKRNRFSDHEFEILQSLGNINPDQKNNGRNAAQHQETFKVFFLKG